DPRDWPASFSVFSTDEAARSRVWARLRVYPEAGVRDYQGERFSDWGASLEPPSGDGLPRLLVDGRDITPALEPLPLLSVDRLLLLELIPGEQRQLSVVLDGAC